MDRSLRLMDGGTHHRRRGGQSLAELAVAIPVIFFLLMGALKMVLADLGKRQSPKPASVTPIGA